MPPTDTGFGDQMKFSERILFASESVADLKNKVVEERAEEEWANSERPDWMVTLAMRVGDARIDAVADVVTALVEPLAAKVAKLSSHHAASMTTHTAKSADARTRVHHAVYIAACSDTVEERDMLWRKMADEVRKIIPWVDVDPSKEIA
jgi:hypothetical protein